MGNHPEVKAKPSELEKQIKLLTQELAKQKQRNQQLQHIINGSLPF